MRIPVTRKDIRFMPDPRRVIIRYFDNGIDRTIALVERVLAMSEEEAGFALMHTLREFSKRHRNITDVFNNHFTRVKSQMHAIKIDLGNLSEDKKLLIGSYFSLEYSIESAAFFNPSMVESPDQTGLEKGSKRIIVSFRATGEGHISSIVFHSGVIDRNGIMQFEKSGRYIEEAEMVKRYKYKKISFSSKLKEMNLPQGIIENVMNRLGNEFIYGELLASVNRTLEENNTSAEKKQAIEEIVWLADSHYEVKFSRDTDISERVIFPVSFTERKGIEDARFVKFTEDNGETKYYATYTAYDGNTVLPKLIQTRDFCKFTIKPLHGNGAQNKNLALFPRKVKGKYVMLSRIDGINSFIGFSEKINLWDEPIMLQAPNHFWEFIQIGNCGSPIETPEGWLVITHAVGPVRQYCLSATLLDLDNPTKMIGHLKEPLLVPNSQEREGYVPNVVYSCGAMVHNNELVIPYGLSDTGAGFASVSMNELLAELKS
ncbi:MAG: glycoside hydrolase family 130 protein [Bacteroidales bacterium]